MKRVLETYRILQPAPFKILTILAYLLIGSLLLPASVSAGREPSPFKRLAAWSRSELGTHSEPFLQGEGSGKEPVIRVKWLHELRHAEVAASSNSSSRSRTVERAMRFERTPDSGRIPKWRSLGPSNIAGRLLSIEFQPNHPETVYVGSASGGIWRSTDAGATWSPLDNSLPTLSVGAISVLPTSPQTVVIGTGEPTIGVDGIYGAGILRSTDQGQSWIQTNIVEEPFHPHMGYHAIEANPLTGILLAAGTEGLLRSVDEGATWTSVVGDGNWTDVQWRPESRDSAIAIREYGGVYLSSDGGVSFQPLRSGLPQPSDMGGLGKVCWGGSDSRYVYLSLSAADSFTTLGVYRSIDAGATWQLRSNPDFFGYQGFYNNTIAVDPVDRERVLMGGIFLNLSTDGGVDWTLVGPNVHVDHHACLFRPGTDEVWVGTDGGIFRSLDRGSTWWDRNAGLVTLQLYDACSSWSDSTIGYGGSQDNGLPRYRGSPVWLPDFGGDGMICACDPTDPMHAYGEYQGGYHIVTWDGFASLVSINEGLYGSGRWLTPFDMDPAGARRLFTATSAGIFRSLDGGESWSRVGDGLDIVSISISRVAPRRIWAQERSSGVVRTSTDGGETWTSSMAAPFPGIGGTKILADPHDSLGAFCTYLHHPALPPLILRTTDGGMSWTDATGDLGEQSVNTIAIDPSDEKRWFVGTDVGVWISENRGATWRPYGKGLPHVLVLDLEFRGSSGELRAGTFGRGLWSVSAGVNQFAQLSPMLPEILQVTSQNPSEGDFEFRFGARSGRWQSLGVYTVTGKCVKILFEGAADALVRNTRWSARELPAGVYFVALHCGSNVLSKKIVVLR